MLEKVLKEYQHLQRTKIGVDLSLKKKEVELATECRKVLAQKIRCDCRVVLMAAILLEKINGR